MKDYSWKKAMWLLLLITVMGGIFRFVCLDRPVIWTDEAYTHFRVSGSFEQMIGILRTDGFSPLHYELYWALGHALGGAQHLTPAWMRVFPALWGTLQIPAMYFLARQFFTRKIALMTALATACSAYMMVYSHDAKMYMLLWLGVTLSMGALFCWLRTSIRLAFCGWVASSLLMCGTHALGLVILALEFLIVLTSPKGDIKKIGWFVLGLGIILSGPGIYYTRFNRWTHALQDNGWRSSGLEWIAQAVEGRDGGNMLLQASSAFLFSWEWPRGDYDVINAEPYNANWVFNGMLGGYQIHPAIRWGITTAFWMVAAGCLVGWLWPLFKKKTIPLPDEENCMDSHSRFWLVAWLVLPVFGFYLLNCYGQGKEFASPIYWITGWKWGWVGIGVLLLAGFYFRFIRGLLTLGVLWGLSWVVYGVVKVCLAKTVFGVIGPIWVSRYLGIAWPVMMLGVCAMLARIPGWPVRRIVFGLFISVNLAQGAGRLYAGTEARVDLMVADLYRNRPEYVKVYIQPGSGSPHPAGETLEQPSAAYYAALERKSPWQPTERFNGMLVRREINPTMDSSPVKISGDIQSSPEIERVIAWDRLAIGESEPNEDEVLTALGPGWERVSVQIFPVRYHWNWSRLYTLRRSEYHKSLS